MKNKTIPERRQCISQTAKLDKEITWDFLSLKTLLAGSFPVVGDVPQKKLVLAGALLGLQRILAWAQSRAERYWRHALSPLDATGITGMSNADRRMALKQFFAENADPGSFAFKTGDVAAGIAGTAGAGGCLEKQ